MIMAEAPQAPIQTKRFYPISEPIQTAHSTIEFVFDSQRHANVALKTTRNNDFASHEASVLRELMPLKSPSIIPLLDTFINDSGQMTLVFPKLEPFVGQKLDLADISKYLRQICTVWTFVFDLI